MGFILRYRMKKSDPWITFKFVSNYNSITAAFIQTFLNGLSDSPAFFKGAPSEFKRVLHHCPTSHPRFFPCKQEKSLGTRLFNRFTTQTKSLLHQETFHTSCSKMLSSDGRCKSLKYAARCNVYRNVAKSRRLAYFSYN